MANLSIRARRTKDNPFPRAEGPLARWRNPESGRRYALRADGSVVTQFASSTWNAMPTKGLTIEQVDQQLSIHGFKRE